MLAHLPSVQHSLSAFILEYFLIFSLKEIHPSFTPPKHAQCTLPPTIMIWRYCHIRNRSLRNSHPQIVLRQLLLGWKTSHWVDGGDRISFFFFFSWGFLYLQKQNSLVLWSCLEFCIFEQTHIASNIQEKMENSL